MRLAIELPVLRDWSNVGRVRAAIEAAVLAATGDAEIATAAALCAGELGENALKYGAWDRGAQSFRVELTCDDRALRVAVESPAPEGATEPPGDLAAMLRWIAGFPSPEEAYRARVRELAEAGPRAGSDAGAGVSRLGLVRIAYEAGCALRVEIAPGLVRVIAERSR